MALDARIPLGVQPVQIQSPFEAMGQLAQLQEARDVSETRRLAAEETRTKRNRTAKYEQAMQRAVSIGPDGQPTVDYAALLPDLPADVLFEVKKSVDENAERLTRLRTANVTLEEKMATYLGGVAKSVRAAQYHPDAYGMAITNARKVGAFTQEQADRLLNEAAYDPTAIQRHVDRAIAQVSEQAEAPAVGTLGDYLGRVAQTRGVPVAALTPDDITTGRTAFEAAGRAPARETTPAVGSLEDYVVRRFGATPTPEQITQARKDYNQSDDRPGQGADPVLHELRQMQLNAARQDAQAGGTPKQIATFQRIADAYERSPLVKAADRTIILKQAIQAAKADPKNATNQLNLAYSYIQALDTYQSAVREGELQNLGVLGTRLQQLGVTVDRYVTTGAFIPPAVASQIATSAEQLAKTIEAGQQQKRREFGARARTSGVGAMWDDYAQSFQAPVTGTPTTAPGTPPPSPPSGGGGLSYQDYLNRRGGR